MAELAGGEVGPGSKAHRLDELLCLVPEHAVGDAKRPHRVAAAGQHRVLQVLADGQLRKDGCDLKCASDTCPGDHMRRLTGNFALVESHLARAGFEPAGIRLKSVDLPAPFGPMMAWRSPCLTSRLTLSTARRPPKRL